MGNGAAAVLSRIDERNNESSEVLEMRANLEAQACVEFAFEKMLHGLERALEESAETYAILCYEDARPAEGPAKIRTSVTYLGYVKGIHMLITELNEWKISHHTYHDEKQKVPWVVVHPGDVLKVLREIAAAPKDVQSHEWPHVDTR